MTQAGMLKITGAPEDAGAVILKITDTNLHVRLHRARERVRAAVETALLGRKNVM